MSEIRYDNIFDAINRKYESCGPYQWVREYLQNAIEAKATKVHFGLEWQAVSKSGVYRRYIADNGTGMNANELHDYFSAIGASSKSTKSIHDNFGIGSRISSLPWNPKGIVVISRKEGIDSMVMMYLSETSGKYELKDFTVDDRTNPIINPNTVTWPEEGVDWSKMIPSFIQDHGTVVVLLGSEENPDTLRGNPLAGEVTGSGISKYLNTRFWHLENIQLTVADFEKADRSIWATSPGRDTQEKGKVTFLRDQPIRGAEYYAEKHSSDNSKVISSGQVALCNGKINVKWILRDHPREVGKSSVEKYGEDFYVAVKYKNELFDLSDSRVMFRKFGILSSKVAEKLTLIIEPDLFTKESGWGVHPDETRTKLFFSDINEQRATGLPLDEWGAEFISNMPKEIAEAISIADKSDIVEIDKEYRQRLFEKFGSRWLQLKLQEVRKKASALEIAVSLVANSTTSTQEEKGKKDKIISDPIERKKPILVPRRQGVLDENGSSKAELKTLPAEIPLFKFAAADKFLHPWVVASWDKTSSEPRVLINQDSEMLNEVIKHHQSQKHEMFAEQIKSTVLQVYGEVVASKIAHAQSIKKSGITPQSFVENFLSDEALTISLYGLMPEEGLINSRLKTLARPMIVR